ncbi:hypothetical protein E2C01_062394 [Portunus trituberculatus]|uniref:Uncharacterized protein n=1 Tax=Portunus trituberculatus TaxID=210409 RepID=A0A5B7HFY1_PORTR|nr:hypothetical protein [Portunus trituberculatus]
MIILTGCRKDLTPGSPARHHDALARPTLSHPSSSTDGACVAVARLPILWCTLPAMSSVGGGH